MMKRDRVRDSRLAAHNQRDDPAAILTIGQMRLNLLTLTVAADMLQVNRQSFWFGAIL